MRYSGSKRLIINHILPFLQENLNGNNYYVEPFVGGCNSFSKVPYDKKIGCDVNEYVIDMWKYFQDGGKPIKLLTKEEYDDIFLDYKEHTNKYPNWLIGYVGNACSYGSAWFNGYAHYNERKGENHILEAYNGTIKQLESFNNLKNSNFVCANYYDLEIPKNSVIYCDPPYCGTKGYIDSNFDSDRFWNWCIEKKNEGHHVYVSEYNAPSEFKCIWQMNKKDGMGTTIFNRPQNVKVEKLFKV